MNATKPTKQGKSDVQEFVVRYREQLSGAPFAFLTVEGSTEVYTATRLDEAYTEGKRRLEGGPAVEWRVDVVTPA